MWRDAPREYGPPKTLYNLWKRWSDKGILSPDDEWAGRRGVRTEDGGDRHDSPESARRGEQLAVEKGGPGDQMGRLIGRPIRAFMAAGKVSYYKEAAAFLDNLP